MPVALLTIHTTRKPNAGLDLKHMSGLQIHGLVLDVRSGLSEVCASQRLANQGIHILCRAVSELMQGHSIPSKKDLIEFTQHPIWSIDKPQVGHQGPCTMSLAAM